jgi:YgiT-type zinc finger domain-containing protein
MGSRLQDEAAYWGKSAMNQCPVCRTGELRSERVETWMRKGDQWVLFSKVPAIKCDTCGETTFSEDVAERLAGILAPDSTEQSTGSRRSPEYNLEKMDAVRAAASRPKAATGATG